MSTDEQPVAAAAAAAAAAAPAPAPNGDADAKDSKAAPPPPALKQQGHGFVATEMYPVKPTKYFVNIVDGDGNFATNEADLTGLIENAQLKNDAYAIVGIMGCQSSGKSTLLNLLFGTKFREMDSKTGRSQTTLGVWLDAGVNANNLVVMDLEGTDSTERGEDRVTFERQTCMFAMAMAEVLIVNMWEHDIGRYTASNIGILKTVFEVNLQLFSKTNYKTMLLFVVRDHIEEDTPMQALRTKIGNEMNKIWGEVQKPQELKDCALGDFFVFEYVALPHMKLAKAKFTEEVGKLRDRFNNAADPSYFFNTPWHGKKAVPSDGFPHYALQVWESIRKNADLNLPSQKEMLATYRCDEISVTAFNTFSTDVAPLKKRVADAFVDDFGRQATALLGAAMETFEKVGGRYNAEVVASKRKSLHTRVCDELLLLFQSQMKHATKQTVQRFNGEVQKAIGKSDEPAANFYSVMQTARANALKHFAKVFDGSVVAGSEWKVEEFERDVTTRLDAIIAQQRTAQLEKVSAQASRYAKAEMVPDVSAVLRVADDDMWTQIAAAHGKALAHIADTVGALTTDFKCSAAETRAIRTAIKTAVDELVRGQVVQHAELIQLKMRNKFEKIFRLDADGIQIRFKKTDDIRGKWQKAKTSATTLLDLFGTFVLSVHDRTDDLGNALPDGVTAAAAASAAAAADAKSADAKDQKALPASTSSPHLHDDEHDAKHAEDAKLAEERRRHLRAHPEEDPHNIIISPELRKEREAEFQREAAGILKEVEDAVDARERDTQIPKWMYGVLLVLGYDELMTVLRNPITFFFLFVVAAAAFVVWKLGMAGPLLATAKTTIRTIHQSGVIGQTVASVARQFIPVEPPTPSNAAGAGAAGAEPASPVSGAATPKAGASSGPSAADLRSSAATLPARASTGAVAPLQHANSQSSLRLQVPAGAAHVPATPTGLKMPDGAKAPAIQRSTSTGAPSSAPSSS